MTTQPILGDDTADSCFVQELSIPMILITQINIYLNISCLCSTIANSLLITAADTDAEAKEPPKDRRATWLGNSALKIADKH